MTSRFDPRKLLLILLALLAAGSLAWGSRHALRKSDDLMRRAEEVGLFLRGEDPYNDPDMTYPPTALPVFAVLVGPFPEPLLRGAWLVLNLCALGVVCEAVVGLWGGAWPPGVRLAVVLLLLAAKPTRLTLGMGQYSLIALALILRAVQAMRRGRWLTPGLMTGLALAKPTMAVPFLGFLIVRRRWRVLGVAIGLQAVLLAVVATWLQTAPVRLLRSWYAVASKEASAGLIDLPSVAARFGLAQSHAAVPLALAALAACGLILAVGRRKSDLALVSVCGFTAAVFTYHRPYDLVLLYPSLVLILDAAWRRRSPALGVVAVGFAALMVLPSHPAVLPDRLYEQIFIPAAYVLFGLTVALTLGEGPAADPAPPSPS